MKKISKTKNLIAIFITVFTISSFILMPQTKADFDISTQLSGIATMDNTTRSTPSNLGDYIINNTFYIKNVYSGRYLDVYRGNAANGTNVQQCSFNGGNNQKWYVQYNGDGTFSFLSLINTNFALDVYGANSANNANINIWTNHGGDSERFKLYFTDNLLFRIASKISNYERCLVVEGAGCTDESNVIQYDFNNSWNDLWILEPVTRSSTNEWLGIFYAQANAYNRVLAYPNCNNIGGDCTNFVSQCMLAAGIHFENEWYTYRKNGNYSAPSTTTQLDNSWELADPSPWISAKNFEKYWTERKNVLVVKGSDILADSNWYENCGFSLADAVQILSDGFLGIGREATHTMYITGVGTANNGNKCFTVSYHSSDQLDVNLLDIIDSNKYYKFYAL